MAYNSKYTGAEVEALLDKVNDGGGGGYGYWNYYFFEGGSEGDSVVTIDGKEVTVPANTIVEGNFTDDITAIGTNNLKRIITRGDISLSICNSSSSANTVLEEVDMEFSKGFARSFDYMFRNLRGLKRLRVAGGQATGAQYMCYYVGYNVEGDGCEVDIHGMDFSQMTPNNGCYYLFRSAKLVSVDLSGHTFNKNATYLFELAKVNSVDLSGCTFEGDAYDMFDSASIGSLNLSGCTFEGDADWMFGGAQVGSVDMSACDFTKCTDAGYFFFEATIKSLNFNGLILPKDDDANYNFINSLGDMKETEVAISGQFGEIQPTDVDLLGLDLKRGSIMCIIDALESGSGTLTISSYSMSRLTDSDIEVATKAGWTLTA